MSVFVTRLYEAEGVTPEITAVYEFVASLLSTDCTGDKDLTFLTLRVGDQPINTVYTFCMATSISVSYCPYQSIQVLGNMGDIMEAVNPAIMSTLLKCMRQPATTLSVQLAAIQAFRRMTLTDEVTTTPNSELSKTTVMHSDTFVKMCQVAQKSTKRVQVSLFMYALYMLIYMV